MMGYQIQYGTTAIKRYLNDQTDKNNGIMLVLISVCICCLIVFAAIRYKDLLWQWILPGDPEITKTALLNLGENVRQGIPVAEAIDVFCKEILMGAIY